MSGGEERAGNGAVRRAAGVGLMAMAAGAVAFGIIREIRNSDAAKSAADRTTPGVATVYYFHGDTRCDTCVSIEERTGELVRREFATDLSSGRLLFRVVNFDQPADRHFRDDFDLSFGSVVVADGEGRKWENLNDVWTLVHEDRAEFDRYLVDRIRPFVKASP